MWFRFFCVCFFYLGSTVSAQAQDVCTTVIDLQRLFTTLQDVAAQPDPISAAQLAQISEIEVAYTGFSVNWAMEKTDIATQKYSVVDAFALSRSILQSYSGGGATPALLTAKTTSTALDRALGLLGRLDCPPPVGKATRAGAETGLARTASSTGKGAGFDISVNMWRVIFTVSGILIFALGVTALLHFQARQKSLRHRFVCDLTVIYAAQGPSPAQLAGTAQDISRGGVKIAADASAIPPLDTQMNIKIGGIDKKIVVRWRNAHFFGGQFTRPFTVAGLRALIGKKKPKTRTPAAKSAGP